MSRSNQDTDPAPGHSEAPAVSDWTEVAKLQQRLWESAEAVKTMANDVGMAKHILEYDGDRKKRALARAMAAALAGGAPYNKAEAEARASETYKKEFEQLGKEHQAAEQQVIAYDTERLVWETARSLLAMQRETARQL